MTDGPDFREVNCVVVDDELYAHIHAAESSALDSYLDAGAAVISLQKRGRSLRQIIERSGIARSTLLTYRQLAEHRNVIEEARVKNPTLSIRAALKLIAKPKASPLAPASTTNPSPSKLEKPDIAAIVASWTDADWTKAHEELGYNRFLMTMPSSWRAKLHLAAIRPGLRRAQAKYPDVKAKNLTVKHLTLAVDNDGAETPPTTH